MKTGTSPAFAGKRCSAVQILFLLVFAGTMAGSVLSAVMPAEGIWQHPLLRQGIGLAEGGFLIRFWQTAGIGLLWLGLYGLCGTSIAGLPLTAGMLLLRGMAVGAVLTSVYLEQGLSGILTALLYVMPHVLLSSWLIVIAAREAMRLSVRLYELLMGRASAERDLLRAYALRYGLLAVLLTAEGLLQCLLLQCCDV